MSRVANTMTDPTINSYLARLEAAQSAPPSTNGEVTKPAPTAPVPENHTPTSDDFTKMFTVATKEEVADGLETVHPSRVFARLTERKKFEPWSFQKEDLKFLKELRASANWNDMGLGKTPTAIWLWSMLCDREPRVLVVTSKTGKTPYFDMLPHIRPDLPMYNITTDLADIPSGKGVYLAHYNVFQYARRKKVEPDDPMYGINEFQPREPTDLCKQLLDVHWDFVVLDEAHRIKSQTAQCTRNLLQVRTAYKHIMTGTGFINDPSEIWQLLNWLDRLRFPKSEFKSFKKYYCSWTKGADGFKRVRGIKPSKQAEFSELLHSLGVRHYKQDVLDDLPEKYYRKVRVDLNKTQRDMYDGLLHDLETMDQKGTPLWSTNVLSTLQRLRQICVATPEVLSEEWDEELERMKLKIRLVEPSTKLDALMDLLEDTNNPVVIFTNFNDVCDLTENRLASAENPISYVRLKASDNEMERANKVTAFQSENGPQVFLSTTQLGAESITITRASTVIFLDRSWSPKDNKQAEDRLWRPGQKNAVEVIDIIGRNTIDTKILDNNRQKHKWFKEIFRAQETWI